MKRKPIPSLIQNTFAISNTLTGIVKPVVFYKGRFVATWRREKGKIILDIFENLTAKEQVALEEYRKNYETQLSSF